MAEIKIVESPELVFEGNHIYLNTGFRQCVKTILVDKSGKPKNALFYLMNRYLENDENYNSIDIRCNISSLHNRFSHLNFFDICDGVEKLNETGIHMVNQIVRYIHENENFVSSKYGMSYLGLYDECLKSFKDNSYENEMNTIRDDNTSQSNSENVSEDKPIMSGGLSGSEIDLLEKQGLINVSVDGVIEYTESGENNDVFKWVHGSRIFNDCVVGVDEKENTAGINPENKQGSLDSIDVERLVEDGLKENYF